jgi:hypothetical protein
VACALPWGGTLTHGASVPAYKAAIAINCGAIAETRVCNNGQLSGGNAYAACAAPTGPFVQLLAPNGGQVLKANVRQMVQWDSRNLRASQRLTLQFSKDGGGRWASLRTGLRASGRFVWAPTRAQATTLGKMRICLLSRNSPQVCDESDQTFTIVKK